MTETLNFDLNNDKKLSPSEIKELKSTVDLLDFVEEKDRKNFINAFLKLKQQLNSGDIEVNDKMKKIALKIINEGLKKLGYNLKLKENSVEQKDIKKDYTEDIEKSYDKFVKELKERYSPDKVVFVVLSENLVLPVTKEQYKDIINNVGDNYYAILKVLTTLYKNGNITHLGEDINNIKVDDYAVDLYEKLSTGTDIEKLFNISKYVGEVAIAKPELKDNGEYALIRTLTLNMTDPNLTENKGDDIKNNIKDKLEEYNDEVNEYAEELIENNSLETIVNSYWNEFNDLIKTDDPDFKNLSTEIKKFFKGLGYDFDKLYYNQVKELQKYPEEDFKKEFREYLKEKVIGGFVYKNGDWLFSKEALDTASKTGFLKGKVEYKDGDKVESKEVFMAIEKLKDQDKQNILKELDKYLPKELKDKNINTDQLISILDGMVIDMEGAKIIIKGGDIYISKNREYSGSKFESIKIETTNKLTSQDAKLVYVALGSSLLTAGLIKGFPDINLPNIKISLPKVKLDIPDIKLKMNLPWNETVSGILSYFTTSLVLNDKIAGIKKENMYLEGNNIARDYLQYKGIEINDKWKNNFKKYIVQFEGKYLGGIQGDRQMLEGSLDDKNQIKDAWVFYPEYKKIEDAKYETSVKSYKVDINGNVTDIAVKYDKGMLHGEKTYRFKNIEEFKNFIQTGKLPDEKDKESNKADKKEKGKEKLNEFLSDKIDQIATELEKMGSWLGKTTFTKFEDGKYIFDVKGAGTGDIILSPDGKLQSTKYEDMISQVDLKSSAKDIAKDIKEFGDKIYDKYKEELEDEDDHWG